MQDELNDFKEMESIGTNWADLDLKSWNKIPRWAPESGLEIFTFNGFRGRPGQVDMAPLRVRLLRGRKAGWTFHSDAMETGIDPHKAHLLPGEINISQLQGEIEFNTFLFDKPYNRCI